MSFWENWENASQVNRRSSCRHNVCSSSEEERPYEEEKTQQKGRGKGGRKGDRESQGHARIRTPQNKLTYSEFKIRLLALYSNVVRQHDSIVGNTLMATKKRKFPAQTGLFRSFPFKNRPRDSRSQMTPPPPAGKGKKLCISSVMVFLQLAVKNAEYIRIRGRSHSVEAYEFDRRQ